MPWLSVRSLICSPTNSMEGLDAYGLMFFQSLNNALILLSGRLHKLRANAEIYSKSLAFLGFQVK